jgi:hypothetical protein
MHIHGKCHCGAITYEAEIDPAIARLCHCTDCQVFSGAPYRAHVQPLPGTLKMSGTPKVYIKTGDSGRQRAQGFCGECGTALYAADPGEALERIGLRIGAIAERAQLTPSIQIWCDSALPWAFDLQGIDKLSKQS